MTGRSSNRQPVWWLGRGRQATFAVAAISSRARLALASVRERCRAGGVVTSGIWEGGIGAICRSGIAEPQGRHGLPLEGIVQPARRVGGRSLRRARLDELGGLWDPREQTNLMNVLEATNPKFRGRPPAPDWNGHTGTKGMRCRRATSESSLYFTVEWPSPATPAKINTLDLSRGLIDPLGEIPSPRSPLRRYDRGIWDPAEQYWGEPDGMLEMCLVDVITGGPRLQCEFEQVLPGGEDPDAADPVLDGIELRDRGQPARARALLEGVIEWDARCLDAHAHLGMLAFDQDDPAAAQAHYATGVQIAESSLPDGFGGVLGWGWVDNRPFLRCLHGLTISAWRREQHTEAEGLCWALLWLNPADNQGARELLGEIAAGALWPDSR